MKRMISLVSVSMLLFFALVKGVWAQEESFGDKFLGSPLLILTILIIVDLIAVVFHKIRR